MTRYRRSLTLLLIAAALVLAYLAGAMTATGSLATSPRGLVPLALTSAQWTAVQASNTLLAGAPTYYIHLPLVESGQ
jgi:hypothetical protein